MRSTTMLLAFSALLLTGCGVTVQVRDPHGQPVEGARVMVHDDGSPKESALTDRHGEVRFRRIAGSGGWTLEIVAPGFARKTVDRPSGQYIPVTMEFGDEYQRWDARVDGRAEPPPDDRR